MKAIQITVDDGLLARLDADAEVQRLGRSAVFRRAVEAYLSRRRKSAVTDAYRRAYGARSTPADELEGWEDQGGVARSVNRGEIWNCRFKAPAKRRPVLVLSRQEVIGLLHTVMVAPITSTICGAPSEVVLGPAKG